MRQDLTAKQTKVKIQMLKTGEGQLQLIATAQQICFTKAVLF